MNESLVTMFFTFLNFGIVSACIGWVIITKYVPALRTSAQKSDDTDAALKKEVHVLTEECTLLRTQVIRDEKEAERLQNSILQWYSARSITEQKKLTDQKQYRDYLKATLHRRLHYVADSVLQHTIFNKALASASCELQEIFADPKEVSVYCNEILSNARHKESSL
jgi:hypothetical protein